MGKSLKDKAHDELRKSGSAEYNLGQREVFALRAQVYATLALVEAQKEATAWGKEMVQTMADQQTKFLEDMREELKNA